MPVYLVRLRDDDQPAPKPALAADFPEDGSNGPESEAATTYFIGIFHERNLTELFWAVDEQLDPGRCEYIVLKPGRALFFTEDGGDELRLRYNEPLFSDELDGKLKWRRIPHWTKAP